MPPTTIDEMFHQADQRLDRAWRLLADAADWLRSDWNDGRPLTNAEAKRRDRMNRAIADAQSLIEKARG